jgi:hypothetical protein
MRRRAGLGSEDDIQPADLETTMFSEGVRVGRGGFYVERREAVSNGRD